MKDNRENRWLRPRGYIHFTNKSDARDYNEQHHLYGYTTNKDTVAKHSFYPLIHRPITQRHYKKVFNSDGDCIGRAHTFLNEKGEKESNAKTRHIFYSTHKDATIYSYYTEVVLCPMYQDYVLSVPGLSDCISAYRKIPTVTDPDRNKCNIHFADDVFKFISTKEECVALCFDVSKFFDSLDHKYLKKAWCKLIGGINLPPDQYNVFRSVTKFSYVEYFHVLKEFGIKNQDELYKKEVISFCKSPEEFRRRISEKKMIRNHPFVNKDTKKFIGIPQGTPISAFLSNLYMLEFDEFMYNEITVKRDGLYRRYSDDIMVVCPTQDKLEVRKLVVDWLVNKAHLIINEAKVEESTFTTVDNKLTTDKPLQYLGFEYDGQRVLIRNASIAKFVRQMKKSVRASARMAWHNKGVARSKGRTTKRGMIYRGSIFSKYSHLAVKGRRRNMYIYAKEASEIMGEKAIKKQFSMAWSNLMAEMTKQERLYDL